jgi:hypothetical protein
MLIPYRAASVPGVRCSAHRSRQSAAVLLRPEEAIAVVRYEEELNAPLKSILPGCGTLRGTRPYVPAPDAARCRCLYPGTQAEPLPMGHRLAGQQTRAGKGSAQAISERATRNLHHGPLVQLAPDRTIFVRSGVDSEIVIGRIVDNFQYLPARAMHATRGPVSLPVEALPIKEVKPMRAVVSTRGGVEMEGSHNTVESVPGEDVTGRLSCWVEVESSHAPPATVSAIAHLIARQENRDVTIAVLVHWVGVLRRSRGWWSEHQDRGGEGQAGSRPSRIADAYAMLHRGPFLSLWAIPEFTSAGLGHMSRISSRVTFWLPPRTRARTAGTKNCRCDCSPDLSQG